MLVCPLADPLELEFIGRVVEMELAGAVDGMEFVLEGEGGDGGLGELCVDGLDVDGAVLGVGALGVFVEVCWANTKAGTRRTIAARLDRRMEYLRIPSQEAVPTYSSLGS